MHCRKKTLQTDGQTAQIWWKISSRDPNSGADETKNDGNWQSSGKKYTVCEISCKDEPWKNKSCKLMTKPRRYGGKSHPATPTQEQTSPISTETSNLYKKYAVFDVSCKNEDWKKNTLRLMTKLRRYGGKSHPGTPTQEQTRPKTTETGNLVEKSTLFVRFPAKTSLEKTKVASWWPNRADMVENLIPRRQLRSKRAQYRRKLAIYTKNTLFLMSPAKTSLEKKKCCKLMIKPRRYGGKSHPGTPTQEQTRPITTETSNLVEKSTLWFSCKDEH